MTVFCKVKRSVVVGAAAGAILLAGQPSHAMKVNFLNSWLGGSGSDLHPRVMAHDMQRD